MNNRIKMFYMGIAQSASKMSYANRLKVGCVVVKDNNIISFSWNGTPSGWDNSCEDEQGNTKSNVIHAEENAILKLAKTSISGEGASLFCTVAPCINCARMIYGMGIKEVYYINEYRNADGLEFLQKCGIYTEKIIA
jgi:dCMP deaminase